MVGKEVVEGSSEVNTLQEGAGETAPLKQKGDFERSPHPGYVYFVRAGETIKIGFSRNPPERAACGAHTPLGNRYSNLIEQIRNYEHADNREVLAVNIAQTTAEIERLSLAA